MHGQLGRSGSLRGVSLLHRRVHFRSPWHLEPTPLQMHVAELRRHKRAFLRLVTNLSLTKAPDAVTAQRMFVDYLADQLTQQ